MMAKKAGFFGIDLSMSATEYDTQDAEYIRTLETITGIKVKSITAYERKMTEEIVDQIMKIAISLDVKTVNFYPPHRSDKNKEWFWEHLAWVQKKYPNIKICAINAPPKTILFIISEYGDARPEIIKKITGNTALSISNVDPSSGIDLMKTFTILGNSIQHIYLSDKKEEKEGVFFWNGEMPIESLLIKLKELWYNGTFSISLNPKELLVWDDDKVIRKLQDAQRYFEKYFHV